MGIGLVVSPNCNVMKNPKSFTQMVRGFRKSNKLTVQQAAAHLDVPYRTYQTWISKTPLLPPSYRQTLILQRIEQFNK